MRVKSRYRFRNLKRTNQDCKIILIYKIMLQIEEDMKKKMYKWIKWIQMRIVSMHIKEPKL